MKQQTAVEWLEHHLKDFFQIDFSHLEYMTRAFDQAKAMEKEQIMNAYLEGESDADHSDDSALRFYNETYGGDK
jgi:ABC-type amino acid transport substrate-binding protein